MKENGETVFPPLERVELGETVVWSTKHSASINNAALAAFKTQWSAVAIGT